MVIELIYLIWVRYEKLMVWWWSHTRDDEEHKDRLVWVHRRECADGVVGKRTTSKPKGRISRLLDLALWYLFYPVVLKIKRSDW